MASDAVKVIIKEAIDRVMGTNPIDPLDPDGSIDFDIGGPVLGQGELDQIFGPIGAPAWRIEDILGPGGVDGGTTQIVEGGVTIEFPDIPIESGGGGLGISGIDTAIIIGIIGIGAGAAHDLGNDLGHELGWLTLPGVPDNPPIPDLLPKPDREPPRIRENIPPGFDSINNPPAPKPLRKPSPLEQMLPPINEANNPTPPQRRIGELVGELAR